MSHLNKILGLLLTAFLLIAVNPAPTRAQPGVSVSFQTFYDELQPYGTWIDDPDYGDVWVPDVDEDFKPYATNGHWIVTDYGNTWESDYEWGWAPFHYGRWRFDDYYGWEWIPGSEWGPAWVNWRTGGGYYAWAPLGPRVSIDVSFGNDYNIPDDYWVCAPYAYITSPRIYNYYLPRARVVNVIRNTTVINNVYVSNNRRYVSGPRTQDIERYTNHRVDVYRINNVNDPRIRGIQNKTVNIYRPAINRNSGNGADRPRPARVVDASAYRNAHPNEGLGNRGSNGAVANHSNASKLAQTARDPHPENSNVVRVYRPGNNNGMPNGTNSGRFNRTGNQPNQPGQSNPGNNNGANHTTGQGNTPTRVGPVSGTLPANGTDGSYNHDRNRPGQNGQPVQGTSAPVNNSQPAQNNPAGENHSNNGKFGHGRDQQNQGGQSAHATPSNGAQPVQAAPANATPIPNTTTTPANPTGGFNRSRYRPNQPNPSNSTPPASNNPAVTQPQTDQQAQQREQQRQQHMQQRQQQQAQPQLNNEQQRQQQAQQQQQRQQQAQQQQQRQQQAQQQQQRQQQRPKPEHKDEHPPQ